jgi:hypothetical protein
MVSTQPKSVQGLWLDNNGHKVCLLENSPGAKFLCNLKSHHVDGNAPRLGLMSGRVKGEGGVLRNSVIEAIDNVVLGPDREKFYKDFGTGEGLENPILDSSRLPDTWNKWIRTNLSVPRCVNSVSLLIFMVVDILVWIVLLKVIRWMVQKKYGQIPADQDTDTPKEREALKARRNTRWWILFASSTLLAIVVCTGLFSLLHARFPYIEEPFLVLTVVITLYMAASEQLDTFLPDIPS